MSDDRVHGGDPCPRCGAELDWDQQEITDSEGFPDWVPFITHPEPQCGWRPDGYPSTREGWGEPPGQA
jgi:hypothetical protein